MLLRTTSATRLRSRKRGSKRRVFAVILTRGSISPREMFDDIRDDLKDSFSKDKKTIKQALKVLKVTPVLLVQRDLKVYKV